MEYTPHKLFWTKLDGTEEHVRGELYNSDMWLAEHEAIQNLSITTPEPCSLERAIATMMFYSDATHVAQFGQNSVWPVYLYFGNESKYYQRKLTARVCEHVAFLLKASGFVCTQPYHTQLIIFHNDKLPAEVQDQAQKTADGKAARPPLMAHLKHELFQACFHQLLDSRFFDAYANGMVIKRSDGVERWLFPRIFTYSADYPEKYVYFADSLGSAN